MEETPSSARRGEKLAYGNAPALTGEWGGRYFEKLRRLFQTTGFGVFEHDGSYPGDRDGFLHVNPALDERAFLTAFNPPDQAITREILVPLHHAGLDSGAGPVR